MSSCCKTPPASAPLPERMGNYELFNGGRTPHGEKIVSAVSTQLKTEDLAALPPNEVLQAKPHEVIALSRARLESRSGEAA